MAPKTHRTAVVAMPPQCVWEPIQAIRRQHDRQIHRWMPHINLLYPFVPREAFATALPLLTAACQSVPAFEVTLTRMRSFSHASGRGTVWLQPEPGDAFVRLQSALQAAFPDYSEQSRFAAGFTPHLSVGQVASRSAIQSLLTALQATWTPVHFILEAVALIWREAHTPFQVEHWISLADLATR
jgi:2'-5' RNA ligase